MKRNNKGFSLIELMVVIAMLVIFVGVMATSLAPMFARQAQTAAATMNEMLAKCKVYSMTYSGETYLRLYVERPASGMSVTDVTSSRTTRIYAEIWHNDEIIQTELLSSRRVDIRFSGSASGVTRLTNADYWISFSRTTGALDTCGFNYNTSNGDITGPTSANNINASLPAQAWTRRFLFSDGGRTYEVQIIPQTGKHEVVRTA